MVRRGACVGCLRGPESGVSRVLPGGSAWADGPVSKQDWSSLSGPLRGQETGPSSTRIGTCTAVFPMSWVVTLQMSRMV
jgi:hypothetical protein